MLTFLGTALLLAIILTAFTIYMILYKHQHIVLTVYLIDIIIFIGTYFLTILVISYLIYQIIYGSVFHLSQAVLFITLAGKKPISWYVQESIPLPYHQVHEVIDIQADGHEMDAIVNLYVADFKTIIVPSIPLAKGIRVQRWIGDTARNIIAGLMQKYGHQG